MERVYNISKTILRYLNILLLVAYFIGATSFWHTHIINNEVITHSHPFSSTNHQHTSPEISYISLLSLIAALTVVTLTVDKVYRKLNYVIGNSVVLTNVDDNLYTLPLLRAPPVYC